MALLGGDSRRGKERERRGINGPTIQKKNVQVNSMYTTYNLCGKVIF